MSTGDRTWNCPDPEQTGCPVNYSGGEDLIIAQAIDHMQTSHGREISREEVLATASEPEA